MMYKNLLPILSHFLFLYLVVINLPNDSWSQSVVDGYSVESLLPVGDLLSGITHFGDDILVCEYDRDRILWITLDGEVTPFVTDVKTPVDVEVVGQTLWILLQEPGELVEVNMRTKERRTLVEGLFSPTAMALAENNNVVYVIEFLTGQLIQIDLKTGNQTVIKDTLNNPADIAVLPNGELYIAEQVGFDLAGGILESFPEDSGAPSRETGVIDPSGIAIRPDGTLLITSFFIPECGTGGVVSLNRQNEQSTLSCNLLGPTGLTVLSNGWVAVIEEVTNSIVLLMPNGTQRYLVRGSTPFNGFDVFPNGEIVVVDSISGNNITLLHSMRPIIQGAERVAAFSVSPMIQIGGDGNLYVYNALFRETYVYTREGELLSKIDTPFFVDRMLSDPSGGIVLVTNQGRGPQAVRLDLRGINGIDTIAGNANTAYILPDGSIGFLGYNSNSFMMRGEYLIAAMDESHIWYAEKFGTELYLQSGATHQKIATFQDIIIDIAKDSNGVIVGTASGNLFRVNEFSSLDIDAAIPPSIPLPETDINNWLYY